MANKDNLSKTIYLKALKQWMPVTDEYYDQHRREVDAYIHRMRSQRIFWLVEKSTQPFIR